MCLRLCPMFSDLFEKMCLYSRFYSCIFMKIPTPMLNIDP